MKSITFKLNCIPPKSTHQSGLRIIKRKDGSQFVGKFAKSKAKQAQNQLLLLMKEYTPNQPLEGPLKLTVHWAYPYRKSEPKKNRDKAIWCDTRPDCDNLLKGLKDAMGMLGFYKDDAQIAWVEFGKFWGKNHGITVNLKEIS